LVERHLGPPTGSRKRYDVIKSVFLNASELAKSRDWSVPYGRIQWWQACRDPGRAGEAGKMLETAVFHRAPMPVNMGERIG
jgi:hypothetical protein